MKPIPSSRREWIGRRHVKSPPQPSRRLGFLVCKSFEFSKPVFVAGAVYEGVSELAGKSRVRSPLLSRGGVARSAGVVLAKKYDGIGPTPPRLRVFWWLRNFFFDRASTPPLLRRGHYFSRTAIHSRLLSPRLQRIIAAAHSSCTTINFPIWRGEFESGT